jgi:hypothetical protein
MVNFRALLGGDDMPQENNWMNKVGSFMGDPNNQRWMAEMGAGFSRGLGAGEAIGAPTSAHIQRRQFQKGAAKSQQEEKDFRKQIIDFLHRDAGLLSPKGDMSGADSVTIGGDGTYTIKGGTPGKTQSFGRPGDYSIGAPGLSDKPLEAIPGQGGMSRNRSADLSPFF